MKKSYLLKVAAVLFFIAGAASMFARQLTLGCVWIALGAAFVALAKKKKN